MERSENRAERRLVGLSRRGWLFGTAGAVLGLAPWPVRGDQPPAGEAALAEAIQAHSVKAGLKNVGVSRTEHYLAVGDAPEAYRDESLGLCEKLLASFLEHFRDRGFQPRTPARRMTIVTLAGRHSYERFHGQAVADGDFGHYETEDDWLVTFDVRGATVTKGGPRITNPRTVNTFNLVHEAIHQLTFDTGLLERKADVPKAVSEGLATYGELWQLSNPDFGQFNDLRLQVLKKSRVAWIHVEKLLTDDELFTSARAAQTAYAEAWLLIHLFVRSKPAKLRAYLDLLRTRRDETHRAADAAKALGDLESLDRELKKSARTQL